MEAAIQESLETLMQGKTVIAIAHRLSTIARMDRLVVLEKARSPKAAAIPSCWHTAGFIRGYGSIKPGICRYRLILLGKAPLNSEY